MNYTTFKDIAQRILQCRDSIDEQFWQDSYVMFREALTTWRERYVAVRTDKQLIKEWIEEFYQDATPDTHDYWIASKFAIK